MMRRLTAIGALFTALLLGGVLLSATGSAQTPRPHLFIGSPLLESSGVLIDGVPAAENRVVIATNQSDVEVGRDAIDAAGAWAIAVSTSDAATVALSVLGAIGDVGPLAVEQGGQTTVALAVSSPAVPPTRDVALADGWNLVGWTGATAVDDAIAAITDNVDILFRWDAVAQQFLSFSPTAPPFLNSLDELDFGDGLWVRTTAAGVAWTQPAILVTRAVPLLEGWNLVLWTGPDDAFVIDAVEPFIDRLEALFTWDASSQQFRSYSPNAPTFLNTATLLQTGDGVWLRMSGAATWDQPSP